MTHEALNQTNRRNFIGKLMAMTSISFVGLPMEIFAKSSNQPVKKSADGYAGPWLQNLTPNQVSVLVIEEKDTVTWVEVVDSHSNKRIIRNKKDGLYEVGKGLKIFTIQDLIPGEKYSYRILHKVITDYTTSFMKFAEVTRSPDYIFSAPEQNKNEISFAILNDIHDRPHSFAELLGLNGKDYDYVVLNGDIFNEVRHEDQLINHLFNPVISLFANERPFILVRGNHETRGQFSGKLSDYFVYPGGNYYYNQQMGPVNVTVLDTGEDKADDHQYYAGLVDFDEYRRVQADWLDDVMKSKQFESSLFKVVFMHIAPFHSDQSHGTVHCRKLFTPLFDKYKVDLVVAAHTHRYGIHPVDEDHSYPIVIGGGPNKGERTLIEMYANTEILNVSMFSDSGEAVGNITINARD